MKYICEYTYENLPLKVNSFSRLAENIRGQLEKCNHGGIYNDTVKDIWGSIWKKEPVFVLDNESTADSFFEKKRDAILRRQEEVIIENKRSIYPVELNRVFDSIFSPIVLIKRGSQDISSDYPEKKEAATEQALDREDLKHTKSQVKELIDKKVGDRLDNQQLVPTKDLKTLEEIKEEFDSYFDEESGNTIKEGLEQVDEYLDGELSLLSSNTPGWKNMLNELEQIPVISNKKLKQEVETETKSSKGKEVDAEIKPSKGKAVETETKPNDGSSDTPTSGPFGTPTGGPSDTPSGPSDTPSNPPASQGEAKLSDELLIDPWGDLSSPSSFPGATEEIVGDPWSFLIDMIF